jgi:hypothetical protein
MITQPLSPRSHICQQIEKKKPCSIKFSQGRDSYTTEIDENSDIKSICNEAIGILQRQYDQQLRPPHEFTVLITTQKIPGSENWSTLYSPPPSFQPPDVPYCRSDPGTPTETSI